MEPSRDLKISGKDFLMISNKYPRYHQFLTVTGSSSSLWTLQSLEKKFEKKCETRFGKMYEERFEKRMKKRWSLGIISRASSLLL